MGSEEQSDSPKIAEQHCSFVISSYPRAMRFHFKKSAFWLIMMIALIVSLFWLRIMGSVIVIDETGKVQDAFITDTRGKYQKLWQLSDRYFYTIPDLEGTIEIRCSGGKMFRHGYVTSYLDQKVRVISDGKCSTVEYAD
jgi:hypothetical protein